MRLKLPLHGRSHKATGADPIPGLITYDTLNVGDWLYIKTTGSGGPLGRGVTFEFAPGGVEFHSTDGVVDFDLLMDSYDFTLAVQNITLSTIDPASSSTGIFEINLGRDLNINMPSTGVYALRVKDGLSEVFEINRVGDINVSPIADLVIALAAGQKFTVLDSTNAPKLQWTEGTADLHIPTGGTVVADL